MEPTEHEERPQQDFARLQREHERALQFSREQIQKWEQFKSDYEALQARLCTLPDKLTHDVMVPFGRFAFMPGQLYHTNEILVLLGDNWFAKRSAKQAIEIAERRKQYVSKLLADEKKQLSDWEARLAFTDGFKSTVEEHEGTVEIKEEYQPSEEEKARKGKTRTQRKSRAPPPRQVFPRGTPTAPPPSTLVERDREEERLWARLEQLEGEEEEFLKHEAGRELGESESLVKGADANPLERELLSKKGGMQQDRESSGITDATGNLKVKAPSNVSHEQGKDRDYEKKESSADELKRKVTFVGDKSRDARTSDGGSGRRDEVFTGDKPSPLRITVTHTRTEPSAVDLESCEASSSSEGSKKELFTSPADIYRHFYKPALVSDDSEQDEEDGVQVPQKAVSWDSKLVSYSGEKRASPSNQTEASAAATVTQAKKPPVASAVAFSGRVVERVSSRNISSAPDPSKKISKFKASRQNKT